MGANEYKWAQSSNNTTLLSKNVNFASFDNVHLFRLFTDRELIK
jgi:hypothetical protein